jgi:hypothetical protein
MIIDNKRGLTEINHRYFGLFHKWADNKWIVIDILLCSLPLAKANGLLMKIDKALAKTGKTIKLLALFWKDTYFTKPIK